MLQAKSRRTIYLVCLGITSFLFLNYFWLKDLSWKDTAHVKIWPAPNEADEITLLQAKRPNLPVKFWYAHQQFDMAYNSSCALFPDIMKVRHVHDHWQVLEGTNGTIVKLLGAYLDDRPEANTVRLLTMINRQSPINMTSWCQLWFHDSRKPAIVPVEEYFFLWYAEWYQKKDGEFQPFLLSCRLPSELSYAVPSSVSLVENFCDNATNSLKVSYEKPKGSKKGFAVCTKGVNFVGDITVRLVEWIELMVLLGVDKIYMFDIFASPQVEKLYAYYTAKGVLEVEPLMLPQVQLNEPYLQHMFLQSDDNLQAEVIPYNHCFLKHMYEYEYIVVLDTDEVIVPKGNLTSLREMVTQAQIRASSENLSVGSYIARNCYFFNNATVDNVEPYFSPGVFEGILTTLDSLHIPDYMHMAQRVFRSTQCTPAGEYIKSIHSTEVVLAVHNHYHFRTLDPKWINYDLQMEEGFMHHYRNGCPLELGSVCYTEYQRSFEYDDSVLRCYDQLKTNVIRTLDDLGYF